MKLRYFKTISVEFVPENRQHKGGVWGMDISSAYPFYETVYSKREKTDIVLQFYDEEFSSWVDVPTVVERKGEK